MAKETWGINIIAGIMLVAMAVFIYLLPTYIAIRREHKRTVAIYILNLFFGWTGLVWILTLVMACGKKTED
jgi:hypothetical protein